ncbi:hypothetical protein K438DRAFT_1752495 [Mycena galopus ATCC 62051]|nr:hypothetical protein K438DRAFT_1752495 [Mycena galopus ATCC 62051]
MTAEMVILAYAAVREHPRDNTLSPWDGAQDAPLAQAEATLLTTPAWPASGSPQPIPNIAVLTVFTRIWFASHAACGFTRICRYTILRAVAGEYSQQLLQMRWFPSTPFEPQTAATFEVLDTFHIMTLQGKVTTYDFYSGLEKLKDNTGMEKMKMSTCSGLAALDYANTKFSRGYAATGVGLGVCARHEFVQRNGAADLQKGERYTNMDYIFASLLRHHHPKLLKYISYDICCQWCKHLIERLKSKSLPAALRVTLIIALVRFIIPKLHIYGHKLLCQLLYSLNLILGCARTDGEGIERPWVNIGPVATSTREMGLGSRKDTLDDHWSHWNWQKLIGLGALLLKCLLNAIRKSEHDIQLELAEEETLELTPIHSVSPSAFVLAGLDLEEQQRIHSRHPAGTRGTTTASSGKEGGGSNARGERAVSEQRQESRCFKNVSKIQERLRDAQRRSALEEIREKLLVKSRFCTYKVGNAHHQGATMRARNLMNRNDAKLRVHAEKYIAAWEAKWALVGEENVKWRRLNPKKDLRCMDSEEDRAVRSKRKILGAKRRVGEAATAEDKVEGVQAGQRRKGKTGEGRHNISWIWMGADTTDAAVLTTDWWEERRNVEEFTGLQAEGAHAYAARQADLLRRLASHFEEMWTGLDVLEEVPGEAERRAEELAAAGTTNDDEDDPEEEEDDEAGDAEGEERMEGDDEGSVGGNDNDDDE